VLLESLPQPGVLIHRHIPSLRSVIHVTYEIEPV
jgi:hypothetical protein